MRARIYKPTKTAMQSGRRNTKKWRLVFEPRTVQRVDGLMGWTGAGDTQRQIKLEFDSREDATAYAERHGLDYQVQEPKNRRLRIKAYADNFRYNRPA